MTTYRLTIEFSRNKPTAWLMRWDKWKLGIGTTYYLFLDIPYISGIILTLEPPLVHVSLNRHRHTLVRGIRNRRKEMEK